MGGSENVAKQQQFADAIRDRLLLLSKLYQGKKNSNEAGKATLGESIIELQSKYKEIMSYLNQVKFNLKNNKKRLFFFKK